LIVRDCPVINFKKLNLIPRFHSKNLRNKK